MLCPPSHLPLWSPSTLQLAPLLSSSTPISHPDVLSIVQSDPLLLFNIIRLANSPAYAPFGQKNLSTSTALRILQKNHLQNFIQHHPTVSPHDLNEHLSAFRKEYLKTATASQILHQILPLIQPSTTPTPLTDCTLATLPYRIPYLHHSLHSPKTWTQIDVHLRSGQSASDAFAHANLNLNTLQSNAHASFAPLHPSTSPLFPSIPTHILHTLQNLTDQLFDTTLTSAQTSAFASALDINSETLLSLATNAQRAALSSLGADRSDTILNSLTGSNPPVLHALLNVFNNWKPPSNPLDIPRDILSILDSHLSCAHSIYLACTPPSLSPHGACFNNPAHPLPHHSRLSVPLPKKPFPPRTHLNVIVSTFLSGKASHIENPSPSIFPPEWSFAHCATEALILPILTLRQGYPLPPAFTYSPEAFSNLPNEAFLPSGILYFDWTRATPPPALTPSERDQFFDLLKSIQLKIAAALPPLPPANANH